MEILRFDDEDAPSSQQAGYLLQLKLWVPPTHFLASLFIGFIHQGNGLGNAPDGRSSRHIAARIMIARNALGKYLTKAVTFEEDGEKITGTVEYLIPKPRDPSLRSGILGEGYTDDKKPFYARVITPQGERRFKQLSQLTLIPL